MSADSDSWLSLQHVYVPLMARLHGFPGWQAGVWDKVLKQKVKQSSMRSALRLHEAVTSRHVVIDGAI